MSSKRFKTIVAIELGNRRLSAVEMHGGPSEPLQLRHCARGTLALDPLNASPELAAREIRNLLDQAGIKTRQCILCVPLNQVLLHTVAIPAIEEADMDAFVALEAERAFPFPPADLMVSHSRNALDETTRFATLAAVPSAQLATLQAVLRLANLQPVIATTTISALLARATSTESAIALTDSGVEFVVSNKGEVAAMRLLEHAPEQPGKWDDLDYEWMARELRITLGRLPRSTREALQCIRVYGTSEAQRTAIKNLGPELEALALPLEPGNSKEVFALADSTDQQVPIGLFAVAAQYLLNGRTYFNFLPPRISKFGQMSQKFFSQGLTQRLASAAALLAALFIAFYTWQIWQLSSLERSWKKIEPQVSSLKFLQEKQRDYAPWFDDKIHSLEIARTLTSSFPETGSVWTRSFEIKNLANVTCTAYASSNNDALRVLETLRKTSGVGNLKIGPMRGDKPVQFSLSYQWEGLDSHGRE